MVFPQVEIGQDPGAIRDYAQAVEAMGCGHILTHTVGLGLKTSAEHVQAFDRFKKDLLA